MYVEVILGVLLIMSTLQLIVYSLCSQFMCIDPNGSSLYEQSLFVGLVLKLQRRGSREDVSPFTTV
jgi:hypothetical protein